MAEGEAGGRADHLKRKCHSGLTCGRFGIDWSAMAHMVGDALRPSAWIAGGGARLTVDVERSEGSGGDGPAESLGPCYRTMPSRVIEQARARSVLVEGFSRTGKKHRPAGIKPGLPSLVSANAVKGVEPQSGNGGWSARGLLTAWLQVWARPRRAAHASAGSQRGVHPTPTSVPHP
jgi:hypothetical protein